MRRLENPYDHDFCGGENVRHRLPFECSSLTRLAPAPRRGAGRGPSAGEPFGGAQDRDARDEGPRAGRGGYDRTAQACPWAGRRPDRWERDPLDRRQADARSRRAARPARKMPWRGAAPVLCPDRQAGSPNGRTLRPHQAVQTLQSRAPVPAHPPGPAYPQHPAQDIGRRDPGADHLSTIDQGHTNPAPVPAAARLEALLLARPERRVH